ncbi:TRAP transporter large permease subunit [Chloroflexota bacterium]
MEWSLLLLFIFGGLILLLLTGLPISFCFLLINLIGVYIFWGGGVGLSQLILSLFSSIARFNLMAIPLFILMGEFMFRSGLGFDVIRAIDRWLGRLPGRLGLVAVGAGTLFSTTTGSTLGSCAMLGTLLTPEMEKHGYKTPISIGAIMGSGGLAMVIPPSGIAVFLATVAETSVGKLLIAGVVPGIIIAILYSSYIILRCWLQPSIAPSYTPPHISLKEKLIPTLRVVLPLAFIIFMVLGLIFVGVATPAEAAATGVLGTLIVDLRVDLVLWQLRNQLPALSTLQL